MALGVNIVSSFDSKGITKAINDFKKLKTGADKAAFGLLTADRALTNLAKGFAKLSAGAAIGIGVISRPLIMAASNMQESISKVNAVFTEGADEIVAWSDQTAKSLGISKRAALEAAGTYGNLFQAFGLTAPMAKEMSLTLVELAADMASFNNTRVEDALLALRSGLSGETEPLKRYGTVLSDVRLREEARNLGLIKTTKDVLPPAIKAQAAYSLILKDTAIQQGDVERTSDGVAFKMKSLSAQFEDVQATLGKALLPAFDAIVTFLNTNVIPTMETFSLILTEKGVGGAFNFLAGSIVSGITNLGALGKTIVGVTAGFITLKIAVAAYTVAQGAARIATALTTDSLKKAEIQAKLTKASLAFAVGASAAIAAAGIAYAIYAKQKAEATARTRAFVDALKQEGDAQDQALAQLYEQDATTRKLIDTAKKYGISLQDLTRFVQTGDGAFRDFILSLETNDDVSKDNKLTLLALGKQLQDVRRELSLSEVAFNLATNAVGNFTQQSGAAFAAIAAFSGAAQRTSSVLTKYGAAIDGTDMTDFNAGLSDTAKKTETAQEKFKKYLQQLRNFKAAKEEYIRAQKDVARTAQDLTDATNKQSLAQAKFNQLIKGFGASSKEALDAQNSLASAQRNAERAGYDLERAQLAVSDAERALVEARRSGNQREIREAEIALAEAKLNVKDAEDALTQSSSEVTDAQATLTETIEGAKEGSQTYKDALDELTQANRDLKDATDAANEAIKNQQEAQTGSTKAEKQLDKAQKALPKKQRNRAAKLRNKAVAASSLPLPIGLAQGGIVTKPTFALLGEAGESEAVIPLSKMGNMGGTYNITVNAGVGTDGAMVGKQIVQALQDYERRNGGVPIRIK